MTHELFPYLRKGAKAGLWLVTCCYYYYMTHELAGFMRGRLGGAWCSLPMLQGGNGNAVATL